MAEKTSARGSRRIVIAGASGMIGTALTARLKASGDEVVSLVRRPERAQGEVRWDPAAGALDPAVLSGADAVVSLSGAPTARLPWTRAYKEVVMQSRLAVTRTIVDAIHAAQRPPAVFVSGSAVGYYGDRGNEDLAESSPRGTGFLSAVVKAWEEEAARASDATRVAFVRTGLVVGPGGAMNPLGFLAKAGLAGPIGSGRQWWPWISLRDEAAAIDHVIGSRLAGPVAFAGPTPATEAEFMRTLARLVHRPYGMPAPAFALRLALRDAADELLLGSQRMLPAALLQDGFEFRDPTIESALVEYLRAEGHRDAQR
ncbi:TIGR01777 family protein [Planctomonas sp. JC2975]|uniref:TIGR01777 family oxidoreductase n=1 Tax=Planctomonas sp. JC2975 TaxID=2729626 RepID=UPI0014747576|nr:TIGR01777 family oxidoreductase [Planctomonas sp. JC2975]NNC12632.1 TIGR01777 family protein [Planctomonas sp. JC2975]